MCAMYHALRAPDSPYNRAHSYDSAQLYDSAYSQCVRVRNARQGRDFLRVWHCFSETAAERRSERAWLTRRNIDQRDSSTLGISCVEFSTQKMTRCNNPGQCLSAAAMSRTRTPREGVATTSCLAKAHDFRALSLARARQQPQYVCQTTSVSTAALF